MDTWLIRRLGGWKHPLLSSSLVCQACATLPACQAWEWAALPLSLPLSLSNGVCGFRIGVGLHIIWANGLENVLESWNSAPERTGNSYVRETWQIQRQPRVQAAQIHTKLVFQHYSSNKNPSVDVLHFPLLHTKTLGNIISEVMRHHFKNFWDYSCSELLVLPVFNSCAVHLHSLPRHLTSLITLLRTLFPLSV